MEGNVIDRYEWNQIYKKMRESEEYLDFIRRLAEWDGTTDSFYDLFDGFRKEAQQILRQP